MTVDGMWGRRERARRTRSGVPLVVPSFRHSVIPSIRHAVIQNFGADRVHRMPDVVAVVTAPREEGVEPPTLHHGIELGERSELLAGRLLDDDTLIDLFLLEHRGDRGIGDGA